MSFRGHQGAVMSDAKRARVAEDEKILVYRNGNRAQWEVFFVPSTLNKLLEDIGASFGIQARRLFNTKGGEITHVAQIKNRDVLLVSSGEDFIAGPSLSQHSAAVPFCDDAEWVLLNVGGKRFATTRATLSSAGPRSVLAGLWSQGRNGIPVSKDSQGAYLFDRDPQYFRPLLNYLRYKEMILDEGVSAKGVLLEAQHFGVQCAIPALQKLSKEPIASRPTRVVLSSTGNTRSLTREDVIEALGKMPSAQVRFQGTDLSGADLSRLDLNHVNFKWATLRQCNLASAILTHCCFEGADLSEANLEKAHLIAAKFTRAALKGATLKSCTMGDPTGPSEDNADFKEANLLGAVLDDSKMYGVNLKGAMLKNASMRNCDARNVNLTDANVEDCDFGGSDLKDVVLGD
ncbi:BTB/POZ domain-containing protein KCTD9-like [Amblyomma americanum]